MSSKSSIINVMRLAALGTVCFFSLIVLGVSANFVVISSQPFWQLNVGYWPGFDFALAVAVLTLVSFPPLLIVGFIRQGALFSSIVVEVSVLGLFWVFWLATSAYTAQASSFFPMDCNLLVVNYPSFVTPCQQFQVMHAFSWLNWLILTAYWPFLLIMAIVQHSRGNPVWTKPVGEVNMFAPRVMVATQVYPQQQPGVMYAPELMQPQPQIGYPPSTPGATYAPVPTQGAYTLTQPPQVGYAPTPPLQQPQQYPSMGGRYPQV